MRIVCVALALTLAQPVHAADFSWSGGGDDLNAELRYGDAAKTETPISFWCTPHVDIVYVAYFFRPANATEAMEFDFMLEAGGIRIEVGAIGSEILMDRSFVLEGQIPFDRTFVDFISSDGVLTATAEGKTETFPLAGAREAAVPLLEMCGREAP